MFQLYEQEKAENERLRRDVQRVQQDLAETRLDLEKTSPEEWRVPLIIWSHLRQKGRGSGNVFLLFFFFLLLLLIFVCSSVLGSLKFVDILDCSRRVQCSCSLCYVIWLKSLTSLRQKAINQIPISWGLAIISCALVLSQFTFVASQEKRALERKISEMEEELKVSPIPLPVSCDALGCSRSGYIVQYVIILDVGIVLHSAQLPFVILEHFDGTCDVISELKISLSKQLLEQFIAVG